ncbi:hypothetical protein AB0G20_20280 [Streptomyces sp. NPDC024017]|uniref:MmyB family transcriptional regulator n=1 Tax=Streptomyces sp. NPDC024017 TaxID=3154326 RepID=UPI0033F56148
MAARQLRHATVSAGRFVSNSRLDIVATKALASALFAPMFDSHTTGERSRPNFARYYFLDDASHDFVEDWDRAANTTIALLRTEADRYPNDKALRELVGELSTVSTPWTRRRHCMCSIRADIASEANVCANWAAPPAPPAPSSPRWEPSSRTPRHAWALRSRSFPTPCSRRRALA